MIKELILFRLFFSLLLLLSFSPFCTYEPTSQIHPKEVEEDLLKEVQRLRAENAYLKKLQALVLEDERHQHKKQR